MLWVKFLKVDLMYFLVKSRSFNVALGLYIFGRDLFQLSSADITLENVGTQVMSREK